MRRSGQTRKILFFLATVIQLGAVIAFSYWRDHVTCMGVEILTQTALEKFTEYAYRDVAKDLILNGEPAAVDVESSTIYIPQDLTADSTPQNLPGQLRLDATRYQIYFAPDPQFDDLVTAAETGHRFALYVTSGSQKYMKYDVVFTTLPVMRVNGEILREKDHWRNYMYGPLCLWHPNDPDTGRYSVRSSNAEWSIRGGFSTTMPKHSWRVSLKNQKGEKRDMAFAGLGNDDDWILNPMSLDDTFVKEKLAMQMWNELAEQSPWNYKMSMGVYVEVVMNGSYEGIYLLQRKVEGEVLGTSREDIILKGILQKAEGRQVSEVLEIVETPIAEEIAFALAGGILDYSNCDIQNLDNFVDFELFLDWLNAQDNIGYKNTYYVLKRTENGYAMHMVPWDTDMSLGVVWSAEINNFAYYFDSVNMEAERMELPTMRQLYPDLDERLAKRWKKLSEGLFTVAHEQQIVAGLRQQLERSGALDRDLQRWGLVYGGEDSIENLNRYLEVRHQWMNEKYAVAG